MHRAIALALLLVTTSLFAADAADEVRRTELAFAKAFADRDKDGFFAFLADDAHFLGRARTMANKKEVIEVWSAFFQSSTPPFSWRPERVVTNAAGTLGLSTGPVLDPKGAQVGTFTSTWQKQPDGAWKIIFDGGQQCAPGAEEGMIDGADGVRLHYSKIGTGPTVLIVPGELFLFDDLKQLADQATIIAYDMRNRGRSERTPLDKVSIQGDVRDLEAVRRHFNVDRFVPLGFSYLGLMVGMYAVEHPERVERMIQMGPVPMVAGTKYPAELTHGFDDIGASAEDVKRWQQGNPPCDVDFNVMKFVLVGNPANASKVRSQCALENEQPAVLQEHFARSFASQLKLVPKKDDFRRITVPALVIHGTFDRNAPYGSGREWASTLPDARLLTIPGAGHAAWLEAPEVIFPAIRQFLRGEWPKEAVKP